jgi:hypothetical protein
LALDPSAHWVQAGRGALGNVGRNTVNTYNTFNHRNFSRGLPTNNGALDQNTNGNSQDLAYALVTNAQFLKNKAFNGGGRNMQLGLRFVW